MSRSLNPTELKRLNRAWRRSTQARLALLLDGVGQPFNVGSIFRSAATFGVESMWLAKATSPLHPSARKTSMGTERQVEWAEVETPAAGIAAARAAGYRVVAIELAEGAVPLHAADLSGDVCLIVGGEERGCSATSLGAADQVAYIPQVGKVGSLNVAVAAGIALAEARRREWSTLPAAPEAESD